ncbi:hydrogenase subunit MbhD domain-containing protein [Desulfobacter postgatei]|uniref:hydrogenase subunit MbhD domain-containing protein n=1 Tax=Desulfobacter postgatei TaxID=2293 RepID=UPI00259BEE6F|nr:hydrogenase subunit MbhD domain-containing protein [uncultured Desulfobacter sp.]
MTETPILFSIALLLPLSALLTVIQRNPYNALISRGVLGAVSALAYTSLGAADVAVTEALMGSLLIIVLYTIAVRSTMVIRLGVVRPQGTPSASVETVTAAIKAACRKKYLRFETTDYGMVEDAINALKNGDADILLGKSDAMVVFTDAAPEHPSGDAPVLVYRPAGLERFARRISMDTGVIAFRRPDTEISKGNH